MNISDRGAFKMNYDLSGEKRRLAQRKERQKEAQYNILAGLDWKSAGSLFIYCYYWKRNHIYFDVGLLYLRNEYECNKFF